MRERPSIMIILAQVLVGEMEHDIVWVSVTSGLGLSGTTRRGTPPKALNASTCSLIQETRVWRGQAARGAYL